MTKRRSLADLYRDRCRVDSEGNLKPTFWKPRAMDSRRQVCIMGDERNKFDPETEQKALACMQRLIALGLELELPVGQFVSAQSEVPNAPFVRELLKSAVADEARHELGFQYAAKAYGAADRAPAEELKARWSALAAKYQPIAVAGALEQEVFLPTLGLMRLAGGSEMSSLALKIAEDESRHVATNRAIGKWLGVSFGSDLTEAVDATIDYALGDLRFTAAGVDIDYDFLVASSRSIRDTGVAPVLDDLTSASLMQSPFEISNDKIYDRETSDGRVGY